MSGERDEVALAALEKFVGSRLGIAGDTSVIASHFSSCYTANMPLSSSMIRWFPRY
jgi:hypothetical protein